MPCWARARDARARAISMFISQGATAFHISLLQPPGASAPAAVLVHAAVSDAQQQVLYGALCDAAQETHEWQVLDTVCAFIVTVPSWNPT